MIVAIICSLISATLISIVWVRLIDQSNKIIEQDKANDTETKG